MRNKLPKSERDGVTESLPTQIKASSDNTESWDAHVPLCQRALAGPPWTTSPPWRGARVYSRDGLAQPACQGAQTRATLVVAKVTIQI